MLVIAFAGMLGRNFWLATGENARLAETAVAGRQKELVLYRTKGLIYDCNLNTLAGDQPCWYMVVNPRNFAQENFDELVRISKKDPSKLKEQLKKETPFVIQTDQKPPQMEGVTVFNGVGRYSGVAAHLLGYLDQAGEVGLSGVEKEYNDFLNLFSSKVCVSYKTDAVQGALSGLGIRKEGEQRSKNGLVLTLDKSICRALEESMEQHVEVGAAIVMDCNTGELKAVCSRPGYEEECIAEYLESSGGELINRAFGAYSVGSVFKIILAACALEAGMGDFTYSCTGGILIGDRTFACHNHQGHGELQLGDAFAESCNAYFIALGQLLGYERIAEMAERFGYGNSIEVLGSIKGAGGIFPIKSSNMSLANLSIGQGELTASPLQVALMTAVVANGGILPQTKLYKGLYLNDKMKINNEETEETRIISSQDAETLKDFCIQTVESGTGKGAKPSVGGAGGKTASAQTGIMENGTEKLNVYFTGFYPADDPQYVITVFAEGGKSGGETCGPVFREMCDFIAENNLTERETVVY